MLAIGGATSYYYDQNGERFCDPNQKHVSDFIFLTRINKTA